MPAHPLEALFHDRASPYDYYVGLVHFATRPATHQRFISVAKRQHRRYSQQVGRWQRLIDVKDRATLQTLKDHILAEASKSDERLAVATAAALVLLDDQLTNSLKDEAHTAKVVLPEDSPFAGARYQLLAPPETPIQQWIDATQSTLDRGNQDFEIDLPGTLGLQWRLFPLDPNPFQVSTTFEELPEHVSTMLRRRLAQRKLTLGAASPVAGLEYHCKGYGDEKHPTDGTPYRFQGLRNDGAVAKGELEAVIQRCHDLQIDILVYPELTLDTDLLGHLQDQLLWSDSPFPAMVVAGSFHEQAQQAGRYVNRSRVFDHQGREILSHDKLKSFRLTPGNIAQIQGPERQAALCQTLGIEAASGGYERIEEGQHLRIVDGPLGRMITSICLDYCGESIDAIAIRSQSNVFWAPAMTPSLGEFTRRARRYGTFCRGMSLVVNSEWLLEATGIDEEKREAFRSFCYLPMHGSIDGELCEETQTLRLFKVGEILDALRGKNPVH